MILEQGISIYTTAQILDVKYSTAKDFIKRVKMDKKGESLITASVGDNRGRRIPKKVKKPDEAIKIEENGE